VEGLLKKKERPTSNVQHRMLNEKKMTKQAYHLEDRLLKKPTIQFFSGAGG
jgi:hypothetical protein